MATVSVCYYDPNIGYSETITKTAELINVQESGNFTVVGMGKVVEVGTVDDQGEPTSYKEPRGIGELRIPTKYITKIDLNYDLPEPEPEPEELVQGDLWEPGASAYEAPTAPYPTSISDYRKG